MPKTKKGEQALPSFASIAAMNHHRDLGLVLSSLKMINLNTVSIAWEKFEQAHPNTTLLFVNQDATLQEIVVSLAIRVMDWRSKRKYRYIQELGTAIDSAMRERLQQR